MFFLAVQVIEAYTKIHTQLSCILYLQDYAR